ncbi:DUF3131 domain-containing protein [Nostoc sp. 106C]|uniref:DUF3131 domain-containing protein n=2 Tax=Nostoc sp. 106C TaxID=1932667 RepID=UPI001FB77818|nr:DUF3131 domain-containing protein [Nostoc sp. 106C]
MNIKNMQQRRRKKLLRWIALFLCGAFLQFLFYLPIIALAENSHSENNSNSCSNITNPLTPEEQNYARIAWEYFVNNYQPATGFTNSTGGYPSGTLWDIGNYLMALNAARWVNLINQSDFDSRLNKFLSTISNLKLFEGALPNKVYHAATGQMVDYGNNPLEQGIGWSALDVGRLLAAFHVIRTCHPQYNDWLKGIVSKWQVGRSLKDGQLFGATVLPNKNTLLVQEGRLGYEEYAVRGYELWGFKAPKALALEPYKMVEINGVQIPVDTRDFQSTNANNYVVSESYILDGIEFGLEGYLQDFATRVLEVQKRRFDSTGQLTAVSEDNIDQAPYFLYNTVYSNGVNWATITDENKPYPQLRSISTKAAFGWRYLFPNNTYAQKVFDAVKDLHSPQGGFYAGLYEESKQPNKALTGNTNGLIMEILYYKARGNRPLIGASGASIAASASQPQPSDPIAKTPPSTVTNNPVNPLSTPAAVVVAPIPAVGNPQPSSCPVPVKPLTVIQKRYAEAAWAYFQANLQSSTGLVSDRSDVKGATFWGLGDYLAALHAARTLDMISLKEFDRRTRQLLAAIAQMPLFAGELPNRGYDIKTLQPVDYGANPVPEGTGWSALDVGRMMAALYNLKTCHPEYTAAVDQIVLDWSYLRVVRNGVIASATASKDKNGRSLPRVKPEIRLGYEEYAARAFQLWGFDVDGSAVGGKYKTATVEGFQVPIERTRTDTNSKVNQYTVSNPFLLYALEFGLDPQMRSLFTPIFQAQAERYHSTGKLTASATTLIERQPYVVHSTIIAHEQPWMALGDDGKPIEDGRLVSTAVAFAYHALLPEDNYAQELVRATTDLYNPLLGFYEGFSEKTGKFTLGFSGSTNSMILQSLLYMATKQPLIRPTTAMNSPWWRAVSSGYSDRGLPTTAKQKSRFVSKTSGNYWISNSSDSHSVTQNR